MASTPKKLVHWALDSSLSELGSPFSNTSSESSATSTSSLQYINSHLIAHGFAPSPGLCLDGISNADCDRVVKCLLGLLSQRVEDMARTEELATKLRTLTYDHERLTSMHRAETEKAANAEREANLHKSRLAATNQRLQSNENAHKLTSAELQRTRTSLIAVRNTHQCEIKKKEKEIERMVERWSKLADSQAKIGAIGSGIRCANVSVAEGSDILGKGQNLFETALEEAERDRTRLIDENSSLHRLVLTAANEAQSVLRLARSVVPENEEEPTPLTLGALPQQAVYEKLISLLSSLRESVLHLTNNLPSQATPAPNNKATVAEGDVEKLQATISSLRAEIDQAREQSAAHAAHTQALFDQVAEGQLMTNGDVREMSVELMTAPAKDEEKERLEAIKRQLEGEREKYTEAAVKLGREKAALEAERIKFLDEKRAWQVELILAELPPTPNAGAGGEGGTSPPSRNGTGKTKAPSKSPRKSPGKKTRVSRRSSSSFVSLSKVIPSYETEVIPALPALPRTSLLPTSFVLPPPSPLSSLPPRLTLLSGSEVPIAAATSAAVDNTTAVAPPPPATPTPAVGIPLPSFPIAKPLAPRMIHAYSPAKPSPLSRILMLAQSPQSPDGGRVGSLEGVVEEEEEGLGELDLSTPGETPALFAAAGVGVVADSGGSGGEDSPLQERKGEPNAVVGVPPPRPLAAMTTTAKGRVLHQIGEVKKFTTVEKGKGKRKVESGGGGGTQNRARVGGSAMAGAVVGGVEKENDAKRAKVSPAGGVGGPTKASVGGEGVKAAAGKSGPGMGLVKPRGRVIGRMPPIGKAGGARRVPVDSAEAGVPGRKGKSA